ncbi:sensor histidine kinase [Brachybacterium alimentarium]|uniref:sensor histidine kinase n=1 Tax=Brachybacterium alimentarium TaxID=47845 RepID=UPI003FD5AC2C
MRQDITHLGPLRPLRRILCEVLAVLLWPLECAAIVLFLVLPFAAAGFAEFERGRARECGEEVASQRPPNQAWTAWVVQRVRTAALWRHDIPLMLASTAAGLAGALALVIAVLVLAVLVVTPFAVARGIGISIGSLLVTGPVGTVLVMLVCLAALAAVAAFLIALSMLRDALARALSHDGTAALTASLHAVRSNRAEIVMAFEQERRRIEQDLHDGIQQDLLALAMTLGMLEYRLEADGGAEHALALRARDQVERTLESLREVVHGIHPKELSDLGLRAAMTGLCERSALAVGFTADGDLDHLDSAVASALYFTAAEALSNVERHAGTERASVSLAREGAHVHLSVTDKGTGTARLVTGRSTGLAGLRERLRGVGGGLSIASEPGNGTRIEATARAHGLITGGDAEPDVDDGPDVDDDSALAGAARRRMS